ncbi:hypothetical protein [Thioclava sp. ES.031]|uniref:hypothetical protein n=1 Tax=Thioclava sp. ES.031 TaxID=1798203 RepID=UPI001145E07A|nr:hypothetical protein [Thioclava sp. ES.031]
MVITAAELHHSGHSRITQHLCPSNDSRADLPAVRRTRSVYTAPARSSGRKGGKQPFAALLPNVGFLLFFSLAAGRAESSATRFAIHERNFLLMHECCQLSLNSAIFTDHQGHCSEDLGGEEKIHFEFSLDRLEEAS